MEMGKSIRKREKLREKKRRNQKRNERNKATLEKANTNSSKSNTADGSATNGMENKQERRSRPTPGREYSTLSTITEPDEDLAQELGHEAAFGFKKTGRAIARFPMNMTLALTQGFHNAPRLYGDETVRRPPRITGVHSGLRAGRDELLYGVKDGVTGIVMQPYRGAKRNGVVGAVRGIGFGIGGFVLKDIAAFLGPFAYSMKGLDAEYNKRYQPTAYLRRARMTQGQVELQMLESQSTVVGVDDAKDGGGKSIENRAQVEQKVSKQWQALQQIIADEKKLHKSGIMASLLGQGESKQGQRVPRKSVEENKEGRLSQSKAKTTPIAQADNPKGNASKNRKKSIDRDSVRKSNDGHTRGGAITRSTTAPITSMKRTEKGDLKDIDAPSAPFELQSSNPAAPNQTEPHVLGDTHLSDRPRNSPDPKLVDGPNPHEEAADRLSALDVETNNIQKYASADASSEKTRVGSDPTDWAAVRHKTEALEDGGRTLEVNI